MYDYRRFQITLAREPGHVEVQLGSTRWEPLSSLGIEPQNYPVSLDPAHHQGADLRVVRGDSAAASQTDRGTALLQCGALTYGFPAFEVGRSVSLAAESIELGILDKSVCRQPYCQSSNKLV